VTVFPHQQIAIQHSDEDTMLDVEVVRDHDVLPIRDFADSLQHLHRRDAFHLGEESGNHNGNNSKLNSTLHHGVNMRIHVSYDSISFIVADITYSPLTNFDLAKCSIFHSKHAVSSFNSPGNLFRMRSVKFHGGDSEVGICTKYFIISASVLSATMGWGDEMLMLYCHLILNSKPLVFIAVL
jgi:hypothetical protein